MATLSGTNLLPKRSRVEKTIKAEVWHQRDRKAFCQVFFISTLTASLLTTQCHLDDSGCLLIKFNLALLNKQKFLLSLVVTVDICWLFKIVFFVKLRLKVRHANMLWRGERSPVWKQLKASQWLPVKASRWLRTEPPALFPPLCLNKMLAH